MNRRAFFQKSGIVALATLWGKNAILAQISPNDLSYELNKVTSIKENMNMCDEMKPKVKITILRRECFEDLQGLYLANPKSGKCPLFYDGQEFLVTDKNYYTMLDGKFCNEAWDCISRYVYAALQGGSIMRDWTNDEKMMIACCNDGTRPVIFKIERLDEKK